MSSDSRKDCTLIDRFSFTQRVGMRLGWYGFMAIGIYGIYKQSPFWAAIYALYSVLGFALVVLPALCAHCPYPSQHGTCLFLPPAFVNRFYPYKGPRMSAVGKITILPVMAGMVILPQFWLFADKPMLMLFWLFGLPTLVAIPVYYCKRCRHFDCPMNKANDDRALSA